MSNIRNFVIIAHVDHGKSTLADRLLEATGTVESRRMRPQYLDQLDLERERGITIKMAPVRMNYHPEIQNPKSQNSNRSQIQSLKGLEIRNPDLEIANPKQEFVLNLIDTPGHSDFSYEVSRALAAVEGAILLVDVTKGIQAQTLSNYRQARKAGLKVIGAVNKIDLQPDQADRVAKSLAELLGVAPEEIFRVSGKTGAGVKELLNGIIERVPPPGIPASSLPQALIFDSLYDDHKGILAYVRVMSGEFKAGQEIELVAGRAKLKLKEVGYFTPQLKSTSVLKMGETGYLATGLKEPAMVKIGDTVRQPGSAIPLLIGYKEPAPVVFISFYPDGTTEFEDLKRGLERLRLTDAALSFEPDANEALGRGLKVGFLGQLHFEITATRLEREFDLQFLTSFPSIAYEIKEKGEWTTIKDPHDFPVSPEEVRQPMIRVEILSPTQYLNQVINLKNIFQLEVEEIKNLGEQVVVSGRMPLAELIRDFDDKLKSVSAGYASFNYELEGMARADVEKLEILIVGEVVPPLTRVVFRKDMEREARATVEKLKDLLPRQQFVQPIQASALGRIIARETIPALKKQLGDFGKNGGDRTRKMKLWKKQQRGKEKLQEMAKVNLSVEVFREILKK